MAVKYMERICCKKIIGVGKHQPLSLGILHPYIAGVAGTATFLVEDASGEHACEPGKSLEVHLVR